MRRRHAGSVRGVLLLGCLGVLFAATTDGSHAEQDVNAWDHAAEGKAVAAASQGFLDAFRAKDDSTMRALAEARTPDPARVLLGLLSSHVTGSLARPPDPKDYLAAARAFVERARSNPAALGTLALLAKWERLGLADLEREERLRAVYRSLARTEAPADCESDLRKIDAARDDLRATPASATAWNLLLERTRVLRSLGRTDEADAAARDAIAHAESMPWPIGVARGARALAIVRQRSGDLAGGAEATATIALVHRSLGDHSTASRAERRRAHILREAARYEEAVQAVRVALRDAEAAGSPSDVGRSLLAEALIRSRTGEREEAVRLAQRAIDELKAAGDAAGEAEAWTALSVVHLGAARFADALGVLEEAVRAAERAGDPVATVAAWTNLGIAHRRVGRLEDALHDQRRAVAEAERSASPAVRATAQGNLGLVEADLGLPEFRATLESALATKRAAGDRVGAFESLVALAGTLARRGEDVARARAMLEEALPEARALRDPGRIASCLDNLAAAEESEGALDAALAHRLEARDLLADLRDGGPVATVEDGLARLLLAKGRPAEAVAAAARAVALRRALASGLGEDDAAGLVDRARSSSDGLLRAAEALAATDPDAAAGAAFEAIEGARGTLLAVAIVNAEALLAAQAPRAARIAEAETRARVEAARARVLATARAPSGGAESMGEARQGLDAAWAEHAKAISRIQRESERVAGIAFPTPVSLDAYRRSLDVTTAFVGYQVTEGPVYALAVTSRGSRLHRLGESAALAERVTSYLRQVSTPGADDEAAAAMLYESLVKPIEADLAGVRRLLVSPDGPLAFLPFEALVRKDERASERLLERWEVSYVPSATVHVALAAEARRVGRGRGFLGVGDPDYGGSQTEERVLTALPKSRDEVLAVAALYPEDRRSVLLGSRATKSALLGALPKDERLAAIHLATHAFLDPERPRLTCFVLAGGEVLDLDAIHRLRIPADLAVLSACSTGRGKLLRGEGVLGFARGFFFAGVPRVVVSDWVVSDTAASALLRDFHAALVRGGLSTGAALREAKRAAIRRGGEHAHPSAWASFVLWGLAE